VNCFFSIAARCALLFAAAAPLRAQGMAKAAKSAMADSEHAAMMTDSTKKHDVMKGKGAMGKNRGSTMKKPMAKESAMGSKKPAATTSGMGMRKSTAKDSGMAMGKPTGKDSGAMKKPQRSR
jgi:hypothetical protein